jgi:hypothetical protein
VSASSELAQQHRVVERTGGSVGGHRLAPKSGEERQRGDVDRRHHRSSGVGVRVETVE